MTLIKGKLYPSMMSETFVCFYETKSDISLAVV